MQLEEPRVHSRNGHGAGSGVRLHFWDPDLNFWEKLEPDSECVVWCI